MVKVKGTSVAVVVTLLCCCLRVTSAAVYISALPDKPDEFKDHEGCYIAETNSMIQFGEQATPLGYCLRIECSNSSLHYATCGVVSTDDPKCYKTEEDLSQPYPTCCPTVKCDSNYLL